MALHNFAELYTEWFAVCTSTTSKFRTIAIFKSFVEENNDSDKTCRWIHNLLCQMSFVWVEPFMSTVHETEYEFQLPDARHFVCFGCHKKGLIKIYSSFQDVSACKCYGVTLSGESFTSTSEVWTTAILEWLKLRLTNYDIEFTFSSMHSLLNVLNVYWLVQKLFARGGGETHTDRKVIS
jgi:hypothetical protein